MSECTHDCSSCGADCSSRDLKAPANAKSKIKKVIDTYVSDGSIILLHDIHEDSVKAMKSVIPDLLEKGYQLVTVSELAAYRGGIAPGHKYSQFRP